MYGETIEILTEWKKPGFTAIQGTAVGNTTNCDLVGIRRRNYDCIIVRGLTPQQIPVVRKPCQVLPRLGGVR
jgi:hypothetical protein